MTVMTLSGFVRAAAPRSESDRPFGVVVVCILAIALFPPPATSSGGPLCNPATLFGAGERLLRALLFSSLYVVLVYSAAPISPMLHDAIVCIFRSAAASAWVIGAVVYSLPLVVLQIALVLYFSFAEQNLEYSNVVASDMAEHTEKRPRSLPQARSPAPAAKNAAANEEEDILVAAAALTRKCPPTTFSPNSGLLSFSLPPIQGNDTLKEAAKYTSEV
jgi:hypothetical protein